MVAGGWFGACAFWGEFGAFWVRNLGFWGQKFVFFFYEGCGGLRPVDFRLNLGHFGFEI